MSSICIPIVLGSKVISTPAPKRPAGEQFESKINIKQIVDNDDIEKFKDLNDSIINLKGVSDLTKQIVLRMKTRRIYKIVGEIELKDYEISMINYPFVESEKVVVDKINIRYYGVEACEYFSNSKYDF